MTGTDSTQINVCPVCNTEAVDDSIEVFHGVCENCGFVVREDSDSVSVEWEVTDGRFEPVEEKEWLSECRVRNGTEQQLAEAFKELEEIGDRLSLSEDIQEETVDIYCDAFRVELTDGRKTACIVAACLHLASRHMSSPIPISRLTEVSEVEDSKFRRSFFALCDELESELPMLKPVDYVPFLYSELRIIDTERKALEDLLSAIEGRQAFVGKDPAGVAAGGLYVQDEQVTQSAVAEVVGLSTETVRQRANQLQEVLDHV